MIQMDQMSLLVMQDLALKGFPSMNIKTLVFGEPDIIIQEVIDHNRMVFPSFEVVVCDPIAGVISGKDRLFEMWKISDEWRWSVACDDPDFVWVDHDLKITSESINFINTDKPYHATDKWGKPREWFFYVNGCCDLYKKALQRKRLLFPNKKIYGARLLEIIDFYEIKSEGYEHLKYSSTKFFNKD